jgi:hypothetical protein
MSAVSESVVGYESQLEGSITLRRQVNITSGTASYWSSLATSTFGMSTPTPFSS